MGGSRAKRIPYRDLIDKMESVNFYIDNQSSVELVIKCPLYGFLNREENNNYISSNRKRLAVLNMSKVTLGYMLHYFRRMIGI